MATDTTAEATATAPISRSGLVPYRLSVAQFGKMIDAGVFRDEDRVELLGGVLVPKMTRNERHAFGVDELCRRIARLLPPEWVERQEKPVILGRTWRPEPDIAVLRGPRESYRERFPARGDVAMIVEVADSSYEVDRSEKWRRYAAAKIPHYGILNLRQRRYEAYRDPIGRGRTASYRVAELHDEAADFPIVIGGRELGRIAVRDVLA